MFGLYIGDMFGVEGGGVILDMYGLFYICLSIIL